MGMITAKQQQKTANYGFSFIYFVYVCVDAMGTPKGRANHSKGLIPLVDPRK